MLAVDHAKARLSPPGVFPLSTPSKSSPVLIDQHPGRSAQTIGIARELGADIDLIHEPSVGVIGNKGDNTF